MTRIATCQGSGMISDVGIIPVVLMQARIAVSADFHQLAEAANLARWGELSAVRGPGDFADVDVPVRVDRQPVRGDELPGSLAGAGVAEPCQPSSGEIVDAHAAAQVGGSRR